MGRRSKRVFITDCEGPITKNDNAAELADSFIPGGDRFFPIISLYDDYLAEIAHRPGYKAGDTLRLILPFFKAFGLDNEEMIKFSRHNIEMIPQADCVLREISELVPTYIVSTSYSPYIKAVCDAMAFPFRNTFSTEVNLDNYDLANAEKSALREIHSQILDLPDFTIPSGAQTPDDLSEDARLTIARLDEIFYTELPLMEINAVVEEVNPIGGREKARAIREIASKEDADLQDVFYVGDSITDVDAFRLVNEFDGMTLSFNGNDWAVREAAFAVTARTALPIGWLATMFINRGPAAFDDLLVSEVTAESSARISALSTQVRKDVRTEKIGSLG